MKYDNLIFNCNMVLEEFPILIDQYRSTKDRYNEVKKFLATYNLDENKDLNKDINEFITFYKFQIFIIIAQLDLAINAKNLIKASNRWEQLFFIRNSCLVIHEIFNKIKIRNKKSFYESIIESKYPDLKSDFNELIISIDLFNNTYPQVSKIRNRAASHYENSFDKFYNSIINAEIEETALIIIEFYRITSLSSNIWKQYSITFKENFNQKLSILNNGFENKLKQINDLINL